jgi:hypothetical protein
MELAGFNWMLLVPVVGLVLLLWGWAKRIQPLLWFGLLLVLALPVLGVVDRVLNSR